MNSNGFKVYKGGRQTDSYLCHNMARSVFFAPSLTGARSLSEADRGNSFQSEWTWTDLETSEERKDGWMEIGRKIKKK